MANQLRGWGVWEQYKWAFNDAMDPWERESEKMTAIKHLNFSDVWLCSRHLPSSFLPLIVISLEKTILSASPTLFLVLRVWRTKRDVPQSNERYARGGRGGVIFESDIQGRNVEDRWKTLQEGRDWLRWTLSSWRGRSWFGLIRAHRWTTYWADEL